MSFLPLLNRLDVLIEELRRLRAVLEGKPPVEGVVPATTTVERLNNRYKVFSLNLAAVRTDEPLGIKALVEAQGVKYARFVTILALPAAMSYRLNSKNADQVSATLGEEIEFEIEEMYITNAALAGTAIIWVEYFVEV